MSKNHPKLILKVEFPNIKDVKFTILQISSDYNTDNGNGSTFFFTSNNWTIYQGTNFHINTNSIISLPKKCLRQETKTLFINDEQRYDFLKEMTHALHSWSGSHFFEKNNIDNNISFHKSIWIII